MSEYRMCVPCLLGLEGLLAGELRHLKLPEVAAENGRVWFSGGPEEAVRANLWVRTGERVLIELGAFPAETFDQLFEGVKALPWERLIPPGGAFPVRGHCLSSRLMSVPDCQRIIKKAAAERLKGAWHLDWCPEDGPEFPIRFQLMKDRASLCLDTTGAPLYRRGYRLKAGTAPLRETLAAGLVAVAGYRGRGDFADPFCGSGTIPIEAALAAKNRAPGLLRSFTAMAWPGFEAPLWEQAREEARSREFQGEYRIFASDLDPAAVELARENARRAGVEELISFSVADAGAFSRRTERGVIVTNPPYGKRLSDQREAEKLYAAFGEAWRKAGSGWKLFLLSAHTEFERCFGAQADRKRKLYNGMLRCDLFIYEGEKSVPPKAGGAEERTAGTAKGRGHCAPAEGGAKGRAEDSARRDRNRPGGGT